ncbi:MAG: hypothetical protein ACLR7Z_15155 [Bilophila wadsworthia]
MQQLEERPGIQCGRHDQQPQIITQALLAIKRKGKPQIGVQAALMKLVKNQAADALKLGIVLEHPGQDAFGHHRNPGGRAHPGIKAHRYPTVWPTFSPSREAMYRAAFRAAMRRGSSIRMPLPSSHAARAMPREPASSCPRRRLLQVYIGSRCPMFQADPGAGPQWAGLLWYD